ncbi:hypothetical protein [Luteimonas saliphila]|uniref:hypothetical protein n=1 Tax=Luteimonas saliphila TaxID=2804919 RepID=UPI00192DD026|nr:hypothetical protein [Luteimonas saliphila]
MDREVIAACGRACEAALIAERIALENGDLNTAADEADDAEQFARIAFAEART